MCQMGSDCTDTAVALRFAQTFHYLQRLVPGEGGHLLQYVQELLISSDFDAERMLLKQQTSVLGHIMEAVRGTDKSAEQRRRELTDTDCGL